MEKLGNEVLTYSIDENSTFKAENLRLHSRGMEFTVNINGKDEKIELSVPGKYNVYNALGSIIAALEEGATVENIREGLKNIQVPGRCEIVTLNHNLGYDVIVDYAHTPDGLENVLKSVRELAKGRLISVFGCGGDRDKTKRPIMGKIGSELSDIAILTSDNPRSEEPLQIIDGVKAGIKKDNYIIIENRRDAIKHAMKIANENDIIVVAGKGHEDYQVLKDKTIHFDEREVIEEIIKELE